MRHVLSAVVAIALFSQQAAEAASYRRVPKIRERVEKAKHVVVGQVREVRAERTRNSYGDEIIVTHALVDVSETIKGPKKNQLQMSVEGGTIGDLTFQTSSMPSVSPGETMVLFLRESTQFGLVPSNRGLGVLKLEDGTRRVRNSSLSVDQIKVEAGKARAGLEERGE